MTILHKIHTRLKALLDWSQQYTRTDMRYVFRGGFWTSFGFTASTILSFLLVIAFANLLPRDAYGTYKYILSISGLLGFLTLSGMNAAVSQAIAQSGHGGILKYAVRIQLRFNSLFFLCSLGLAAYYFTHDNHLLAWSLALLGATFPLTSALNTYGAYLVGTQKFRQENVYAAITSTIQVAVLGATLALTDSVFMLVTAYALGALLPTAYIYRRVSRRLPDDASTEEKSDLLTFSGHLSFLNILSTVNQYLDKVLVFHYLGAVELAVYSLAGAMPGRLKGYAKSLIGITQPKLAQKSISEIQKSLLLRVGQTMLLGALVAGAYWIAAPVVFGLFFPKYLDAISYSRLLMLNFILLVPITYTANALQAQRLIGSIYASSLTANLTRLGFYLVLAPAYGITGVIWAAIGSSTIGLMLNIVLIGRAARDGDENELALGE